MMPAQLLKNFPEIGQRKRMNYFQKDPYLKIILMEVNPTDKTLELKPQPNIEYNRYGKK